MVLDGSDPHPAGCQDFLGPLELLQIVVGDTDAADLAGLHQFRQERCPAFDVGGVVDPVDVHRIRVQILQGALQQVPDRIL